MLAYNVFLNNVRKYDVGRNGKSLIKRLYNTLIFFTDMQNITCISGKLNPYLKHKDKNNLK
jgi:hypothetical protein